MSGFLLRRISFFILTLFAVLIVVFLLLRLIPGDPVEAMLGEGSQQADVQAIRKELMLDRPVWQQFVHYMAGVFHGNLGNSWSFQAPVTRLILSRLPATMQLAFGGMFFAILIAFPLGVLAAMRPNSWRDRLTTVLAVGGGAMPHFWLGPLLVLFFSVWLGWLPVSGRGGFAHLLLPSVTLGLAMSAILARMLRSSLIEELGSDYVRTARAKGAGPARTIWRHALRNASLPIITILGLQFGGLLTGAIITETIFSWPGIGRLLIQAIFSRDYPLVQGCILIFAALYAVVNLLIDLLYGVLDPRIQLRSLHV